jgi:hypothetical protein
VTGKTIYYEASIEIEPLFYKAMTSLHLFPFYCFFTFDVLIAFAVSIFESLLIIPPTLPIIIMIIIAHSAPLHLNEVTQSITAFFKPYHPISKFNFAQVKHVIFNTTAPHYFPRQSHPYPPVKELQQQTNFESYPIIQ